MADCVSFDFVVGHPRAALWPVITDLEQYPRFFRGVGACERAGSEGRGTRYRMRLSLCGPPAEYEWRVLLSRRGEQFVLDSEPDGAGSVSVQLSDAGRGRTRVKCMFFHTPPRMSANELKAWVREAFERIGRRLSETPEPLPEEKPPSHLQVANVLVAAGILATARPDRLVRQLRAAAKWGATLAGGYTSAAARSPKALSMIDDKGPRWSFADLADRTDRLASVLRKMGAAPDNKVAVLARNSSAMVQTLVACGKLGVDALLLNTGLAEQQVLDGVHDNGVRIVVADPEFTSLLQNLPQTTAWVPTDALDPLIDRHQSGPRLGPPATTSQLVVLTSGTTGAPKGARRPTPKGLSAVVALLSRVPLRSLDRILISTPLFHTWGLAALQIAMPLRATVVLQRRFDAEECLRMIEESRCTAMFVVPVMLQRIMALPPEVRARYDTSSLRIVISSGAAMPAALVTGFMDAFGDVLYNFYGSTEVSAAAIATPANLRAAPATAGYAPLGSRLAILGPAGEPLPPGEVGWIYVGNEMLFEGYTDGSGREIRHNLMDTGDRGYLDADGRLFVSGRNDDMIISGGENVFPRPVEEALATLPGVLDATVLGVPDPEYGQRLVAYIVAHPQSGLDEHVVRDFLRHRVARFEMPREVRFVVDLPRTQTGKVLKRLLLEDGWLAGNAGR
ncbi:AMP-binding protein [Amycolatopsis alkalitolerans]|uniref:AMP-binding protein n=1 Tax=Amycolatopsis alkalitolerans TaxID=2547244 RepID=A0A5C4M0T9_9PSEU|nr:AMP-binding protein [Amycolatopsis alkalitolerans]TNC24843.1 AMP-binding protein [Amycolatopsis alkalitolerans]